MPSRLIDKCGACGNPSLETVLDLGSSPPSCSMLTEPGEETIYPLALLRCPICTLVQLSCVVDPEIVFHEKYPYSSGNTKALHANFEELVRLSDFRIGDDLIVDIGANDGTLLSKFRDQGAKRDQLLGVEPTEQIEKTRNSDGTCGWTDYYREFFTTQTAESIVSAYSRAKVVTACNVLAHTEDLEDTLLGIATLLDHDGVLIAENHDLSAIVAGNQWDTIYHEHLRFYSPHSFGMALARAGIEIKSHEPIGTHGGSRRYFCKLASPVRSVPEDGNYNWAELRESADSARAGLRHGLGEVKLKEKRVWGVGSAARATTVMSYCGISRADIECVCEVSGSDKIGHLMPGTSIPVVDEAGLFGEDQPDYALLFSWHIADAIIPKLRELGYQGRFIVPLPRPRVV